MSEVVIRQHFDHGTEGDRAAVTRIFRVGPKIYVEVDHTSDASETTIMVAVNSALDEHEKKHGTQRYEREAHDSDHT